MDPFLFFSVPSHPAPPLKAEASESCPHLVSAKPTVDNTKSKDGFPVLSFEVSLGKLKKKQKNN